MTNSSSKLSSPWQLFDEGRTLGTQGPELGVITRDEEHEDGARITLEENGITAPYAITCGTHSLLIHTRFFAEAAAAQQGFAEMKRDLEYLITLYPKDDDPKANEKLAQYYAAIDHFVHRSSYDS